MTDVKINEEGHTISVKGIVQCGSCKGTGLYQGMAEKNGAAVICSYCEGTGKQEINYVFTKFTGRKTKKGVLRVYQTAGGYGISDKDITTQTGKVIRFSQAGVTYEDWQKGMTPKPIEDLHCPYQHTNQLIQDSSHQAYKLYKEKCAEGLSYGLITDCKYFSDKCDCWKIWHKIVKT